MHRVLGLLTSLLLTLSLAEFSAQGACPNATNKQVRFEPVPSPRLCSDDLQAAERINSQSVGQCVMICARRPTCNSVSFSATLGRCFVSNETDCALSDSLTVWRKVGPGGPSNNVCQILINGRAHALVQRRAHSAPSFARNWTSYETGLGDCSSDYWIGLLGLHKLTNPTGKNLRIELTTPGGAKHVLLYSGFTVGSAASKYSLNYNAMILNNGSSVDPMASMRGMPFSTYDRDSTSDGCATSLLQGGWWMHRCDTLQLFLNGDPASISVWQKLWIMTTNGWMYPTASRLLIEL